MPSGSLQVRPSTRADMAAVDALLARSYPILLKPDYPPNVLVTALPIISRARPELLTCGNYFVVTDGAGAILGAGGWTPGAPSGGATTDRVGHIRHVVTDHTRTRQGIGRRLMERVFETATASGVRLLDCLSTRTAVPFYAARGFEQIVPVDVPLADGIVFPTIRMTRAL